MSCPVCSLSQAFAMKAIGAEAALVTAVGAGMRPETQKDLCKTHKTAVEQAKRSLERLSDD